MLAERLFLWPRPIRAEGCVHTRGKRWVGSGTWRLCISPDAAAEVGLGRGCSQVVLIGSCASQAAPSREKSLSWPLHEWQKCTQSLLNHTLRPFCNGLAPGGLLTPALMGALHRSGCSSFPLRVQWLVVADDPSTSREPLTAWALSGACTDSGAESSTTLRLERLLKQSSCNALSLLQAQGKWQKGSVCQKRMQN